MSMDHISQSGANEKHAGHSLKMFSTRFFISLILTIPIIIYSDVFRSVFGFQAPIFEGVQYMSLVFGSAIFFYGGFVFIIGAKRELQSKNPGMMTLISLAICAAYLYSLFSFFGNIGHDLWWELSTLITIMLLGHWLEMKAVQGAEGTLKELAKLLPDKTEIIRAGRTETILVTDLHVDDIVLVGPGGKIPADGIVVDGRSEVNEAMITGESRPISKNISSSVIAGTINGDGILKVRVAKMGEQTFLAGVMRLVAEAQMSKSRLQLLSDRAAFYLTIIAVVAGSTTFAVWYFVGRDIVFSVERLVSVLVVACPHALGLAVPLVASISTALGAKNGLLIKQRIALEVAKNIDVVLFDKTGTLTKGEYDIENIFPVRVDDATVLRLAAAIDRYSEHMVSKAIVRKFKEKNEAFLDVKDFLRVPGRGVKGMINGEEILVGGTSVLSGLDGNDIILPENVRVIEEKESRENRTVIFVIKNKEILGVISLADVVREESREAITKLKNMGLKIALITGDSEDVAKWVAKDLGIDEYFAKVLPQEKVDKVKILQSKGMKVAMVGDGINDAPALTQADLGVAIGAGTNVAIESAGIILVRNDPRDIVKIIRLSQATYRKMIQNLFWATGYNVIALPLAAGILISKGIVLQPALAAIFMTLSTIIVAINAMLLRKIKLK